jgi:hypothetical protein
MSINDIDSDVLCGVVCTNELLLYRRVIANYVLWRISLRKNVVWTHPSWLGSSDRTIFRWNNQRKQTRLQRLWRSIPSIAYHSRSIKYQAATCPRDSSGFSSCSPVAVSKPAESCSRCRLRAFHSELRGYLRKRVYQVHGRIDRRCDAIHLVACCREGERNSTKYR